MSRWQRWSRRLLPDRRALAAAGLYAGFGAAWIFWSDRLLFDRSSDLPVVQLLGQWKGLAFVALSAAVVYGVARRRRPLRGRAATDDDGSSARLLALLGLAALLIVSLGVVGSVTALNGQRDDTAHLLRTLAAARAEQWGTWVREQQAAASRWDPTLPQWVERVRAAPTDPAATQALEAHLRALCLGARCVDARLLAPGANGRLDAPVLEPVNGVGDPTVSGALLSVARPVYLGAGTPPGRAGAALRRPARPAQPAAARRRQPGRGPAPCAGAGLGRRPARRAARRTGGGGAAGARARRRPAAATGEQRSG